jgi:hypothetical protein
MEDPEIFAALIGVSQIAPLFLLALLPLPVLMPLLVLAGLGLLFFLIQPQWQKAQANLFLDRL